MKLISKALSNTLHATRYTLHASLALILSAAFALPAAAQSAGSTTINAGWSHFSPDDSSDNVTNPGVGGGTFAATGTTVRNTDGAGLAITHFWTDNFATTFDAGLPQRLTFAAQSGVTYGVFGVTDIGYAKQWSPTIVAKWFFGDANSKFRPYVGAGVSYTRYLDVQLTQPFQDFAAGAVTGRGRATAHLSSSWAPVANIGAAYNFDKNWSLGLSVSYSRVKTNVEIFGSGGVVQPTQHAFTTLSINPFVTLLSLGYTF